MSMSPDSRAVRIDSDCGDLILDSSRESNELQVLDVGERRVL
jgi:hypothetical protein